ncbi:N-acetylglucosaminyl-phosphatidylinositol de-N-acetylase, partial [Tetrabaena socialis]
DGFRPWDAEAVTARVAAAVDTLQPDVLLTFDAGGVSGHPNHTSIYRAVRRMVDEEAGAEAAGGGGGGGGGAATRVVKRCSVRTLVTHPLALKFSGPLGAAALLLLPPLARSLGRPEGGGSGGRGGGGEGAADELLLSRDPLQSVRAMLCHRSQFVWLAVL